MEEDWLNEVIANPPKSSDWLDGVVADNTIAASYNKMFAPPIYNVGQTGVGQSMFDENVPFSELGELNEIRSQRQPWAAKFGAGIGRVGSKVLSEIIKLPGMAGGIAAGAIGQLGDVASGEDNTDFMQVAFNNPWIEMSNKLNEEINKEILPVYVSKAVSEGNLWDNISSIDFWATDGADGLGYIVSMLVPGMMINKFNTGAKLLGINKFAKMADKVDEATTNLTRFGLTPQQANLHTATVANTVFEAGVEAQAAMDGYVEGLDEMYRAGELTREEYELEKQKASKIGAQVFASNAAILIGPNAIMSKMIWGGARNKKVGSLFNKGKIAENLKDVSKLKTLKLWGDDFGKAALREGLWEEGLQSTTEQYFTENPDASLTDFIGDLPHAYADMFTDLEGQKAILLGAAFGGGMQAYMGSRQRKAEREATNKLLPHLKNSADILDDIFGVDTYEKTKTGKIKIRQGRPVQDNAAFVEKLKAYEEFEVLSTMFDLAVQQGDENMIEQIKDAAITQLIKPFIMNEELGLDALKQHLTQSEQMIPIAERIDNGSGEFVQSVMRKAEAMQRANKNFNAFGNELIKLENENATEEDKVTFFNQLANKYLNLKGRQDYLKNKVDELQKLRSDVLKDLNLPNEVLNFKDQMAKETKKSRRLKFINDKVTTAETALEQVSNAVEDVWDQKKVSEAFDKAIKNKIEQEKDLENAEQVESEIRKVRSTSSKSDLEEAKKSSNPAVAEAAKKREEELKKEETEEAQAKKTSNRQFKKKKEAVKEAATNIQQNYNEGETVTLPDGAEGVVVEKGPKRVTIQVEEGGKTKTRSYPTSILSTSSPKKKDPKNQVTKSDARVMVLDFKGNLLPFVDESVLEYQNQPRSKKGEKVGFEINTQEKLSNNNVKARELFGAVSSNIETVSKELTDEDIEFLIDYLPINVKLTDDLVAPIETKPSTKKSIEIFEDTTRPLREAIINELLEGTLIEDINTIIAGQKGGEVQVEKEYAENPVHQLYQFGGELKNLKADDIYTADDKGTLKNHKGKIMPVTVKKGVVSDRGKYYLLVKKANGQNFRLRLNDKFLTENESSLIFDIISAHYDEYVKKEYPKLTETSPELQEKIKTLLSAELDFYKKNRMPYKDLTIKDIIDILVYDETGSKRVPKGKDARFKFEKDGSLLVFGETFTKDTLDRSRFLELMRTKRRHVIRKKQKDGGPNALGLDNRKYFEFIIENQILSTNAVINKPTFGGDTTMYLAKDMVSVNGKKSKYNSNPVKPQPVPSQPERVSKPESVQSYKDIPQDPLDEVFGPKNEDAPQLLEEDDTPVNFEAFDVEIEGKPINKSSKKTTPRKKKSSKLELSLTNDQMRSIIDDVKNGNTMLQEPFRYKGNIIAITTDYYVVSIGSNTIKVVRDIGEIKELFDIFENIYVNNPSYKTPFKMETAEALLKERFEEGDSTFTPTPTVTSKNKMTEEEASKNIKKVLLTFKKYIKDMQLVIKKAKNSGLNAVATYEKLVEFLMSKNISKEEIKKKCNL